MYNVGSVGEKKHHLKSAFFAANADRNWLMEHPCCKSHHGTKNSRRFRFRKHACHCTIRKFGNFVLPPPGDKNVDISSMTDFVLRKMRFHSDVAPIELHKP